VVEIVERDRVIVHRSVAETVDAILRGHMVPPESRWRAEGGEVRAATKYDYRIVESPTYGSPFVTAEPGGGHGSFSRRSGLSGLQPLPGGRGRGASVSEPSDGRRQLEEAILASDRSVDTADGEPRARREARVASLRPMSLFPYGVSRKRLEQAVRELSVPVTVARDLEDADAVVTLRTYYRRKPPALRDAEAGGTPLFVLKTNTLVQMESMLANLYELEADPQEAALRETAEAIGLVRDSGHPVELAPQNAYVRRLQHQMAEQHNLMSRSRGSEPNRRVQLLPDEGRAWR
jgi:hypothetical protein